MKKQIRQISKYMAWAMIFAYVLCCISTIEIYAQKTRTAPKPKEVWYLSFELTIKGRGETKRSEAEGFEGSWDIDRTYSGTIELNSSSPTSIDVNKDMNINEILARVNSAPLLWTHTGKDWSQSLMPLKVKIKDKITLKLKEQGEGDSYENTTSVDYYDGDGTTLIDNAVQLLIDKNKSTYNVTIPLNLSTKDTLLNISRHKLIQRSLYGYGGAPTSEPSEKRENAAFGTLKFPMVVGLFENGTIHHPGNLPLKLVQGGYEWDSGDVDIDEPFLRYIPESQEGVKVRIYYRFKKM